MGFTKGLFLGVHASNRSIRLLFLPVLYLLLSTPFTLLLLYYFKVDVRSLASFWKGKSAAEILLQVFASAIAFTLPTRLFSGRFSDKSQDAGKRRVQQLPHWVPALRHWGSVAFGGEGWLKGIRQSCVQPLIAYNAAGAKHNIVFSPPLLEQLLKETGSLEEAEVTRWAGLQNACGMPTGAKDRYLELRQNFTNSFEKHVWKGKKAEKLLSTAFTVLSESLPDLITFNTSVVDQMPWERVAGIELTNGTIEAESELFSLINELFCNAIITSITGSQFPESYQLLASDLWTFNQFYYALANGLPRLFPISGLPGAVLAQKRLLNNLDRLFEELANPPAKRIPDDDESLSGGETDADTPTPLTALNDLFIENEVPIPARAAITLQLLHSIITEVVPLACWTILHIHISSAALAKQEVVADSLIDEIRKETKIWAEGIQPPSIHPAFPAPPEISFMGVPRAVSDTSFPHLRSCINEARRLYKASISTLRVTKPLTLTNTESIRPGAKEQWELDVGSYVDVGISQMLINSSSANFISPNEYKADRFLHHTPPSSVTSPFDPHEPFATALLLAFVAGIIQLWEITPAPKKSFFDHMQEAQAAAAGGEPAPKTGDGKVGAWVVPKAVDGGEVKIPKGDIKVRIRRREGLAERRSLRKGR